jgi:hypothetical protein
MVAVSVVFWSLVVWCSGRYARGTLVASAAGCWALVAGAAGRLLPAAGGGKSGCAGQGPYDSLQPSGPELPG